LLLLLKPFLPLLRENEPVALAASAKKQPKPLRYTLPGLAMLLLAGLAACSPFRLLQPKERLLSRVEVLGKASQTEQDRLLALVQQKPNSRFPLPKLAIYQLGYTFYDRTRILKKQQAIRDEYTKQLAAAGNDSAEIGKLLTARERRLNRKQLALDKGNAIMRLGEAPVVYDSALTSRTVEQMTTFLHSQGYFRSRVRATDTARYRSSLLLRGLHSIGIGRGSNADSADLAKRYRRVTVVYNVEEGQPFLITQLTASIPDSGVAQVVRAGRTESLLKVGEQYNEERIGQERLRLEALLKNAGYYDFRQQYITLEADTSFQPFTVRLRTLVANPGPGLGHRVYRLRRVTLVTDNGAAQVLRRAATGSGAGAVSGVVLPPVRTASDTLRREGALPRASSSTQDPTAGRSSLIPPRPVRPPRDTTIVDSVRYAAYRLLYSTRVLGQKLTLRPGQRYSLVNTQLTQRRLADLDMFRFNTVTYRKVENPVDTTTSVALGVSTPTGASPTRAGAGADALRSQSPPTRASNAKADSAATRQGLLAPVITPNEGLLDAVVNASPAKRFQETTEFGGTLVANLPGPFLNVRLKWRNPFGGAEILELGARVGFEGQYIRLADGSIDQTGRPNTYTTQFGATASLLLPQFLVPFSTGKFLTRYNPKTRFSLSDTYVQRPEYTRTNLELSYDYLWQRNAFHQYVFSPVVINLINASNISARYDSVLNDLKERGSPLYRSFVQQLVPSMAFTSLYNSNDFNETRDARYLRLGVEVGGLTAGLYRDKLRELSGDNSEKGGLQVYTFGRLSADYRRYHRLSPNTYFVYRLNAGLVHALTRTEGQYAIPYDRSFFAGGSTSLRAWGPRRLGPGGYNSLIPQRNDEGKIMYDPRLYDPSIPSDSTILIRDFVSEQPGDVLLEGSMEYRFPIYSFIKGAVFTDFGNVWSLQADDDIPVGRDPDTNKLTGGRPGARFHFNSFYQQIAVGSGFGLRFDFSFLILRLDVATRIYDPTALPGERWALRNFNNSQKNPTAFNLGIGYPF
jgi:hypothetical protein